MKGNYLNISTLLIVLPMIYSGHDRLEHGRLDENSFASQMELRHISLATSFVAKKTLRSSWSD